MRTKLTISYLIHYCLLIIFSMMLQRSYFWEIGKTLYYVCNIVLIIFYLLIGQNEEKYLAQFKKVCLISIMSIFIVMVLNYRGVIEDTYSIIKTFCGLIFVASVLVWKNGTEHGTFKE